MPYAGRLACFKASRNAAARGWHRLPPLEHGSRRADVARMAADATDATEAADSRSGRFRVKHEGGEEREERGDDGGEVHDDWLGVYVQADGGSRGLG
jgi:hypothetical protein